MSVIACEETWVGRGGSEDIDLKLEDTRVYNVRTDNAQDSAEDIKLAGVLPLLRSPHPKAPQRMWLINRQFDQDNRDPKFWIVTCSYASFTGLRGGISSSGGGGGGGTPNAEQPNPLLKKPELSFSFIKQDKEIEYDFSDPPRRVANSATDPFLPGMTTPEAGLQMTYTVNKPFYNPRLLPKRGSINSSLFFDYFFAYELLYDDHNADDDHDPICGVYWRLTHKFLVKFRSGVAGSDDEFGWRDTFVVDKGFREAINVGGEILMQEITDRWGNRVSQPANLDGAGEKQDHGETPVKTWANGSPYRRFPTADFSVLQ